MSEWTDREVIDALLLAEHFAIRNADAEVMRAAADALARHQWVSVEDRLPRNGSHVLVFGPAWASRFMVCWFTGRKFFEPIDSDDVTPEITHWIPLPAPPEAE